MTSDFSVNVHTILWALQSKKIPKICVNYGSGWESRSYSEIFVIGQLSQNSPIPVRIFLSSIPCIFCLYPTLLKVVIYYDLSVLFMSVVGFR